MPFNDTQYTITPQYLPVTTKRRPGQPIAPAVKFIVAHDTGNAGSTARNNVDYYTRSANDMYASAHIFVDDKEIIECIPALTGAPEKAWHVRYDVPKDNELYGFEANDTAIGVEYCYGTNINADEAYARYVWVLAKICKQFNLTPPAAITGHFILDPTRRSDPVSGLAASNRTYEQLLADVTKAWQGTAQPIPTPPTTIPAKPAVRLIQNPASNKVYAVGADRKKRWIFNEATFIAGQSMGLWGAWSTIETVPDDGYAEGETIIFV